MLSPGNTAPHFNLPDQTGLKQDSKALKGKRYLVYFYPKDSTPGCTTQACGLQSDLEQFNDLGIAVFGVSMDSVASHKKFADKYGLKFPLLTDTEKSLIEAYGVWVEKSLYGKKYMGTERTTFVIDPKGNLKAIFPKVKPEEHFAQVLAAIAG